MKRYFLAFLAALIAFLGCMTMLKINYTSIQESLLTCYTEEKYPRYDEIIGEGGELPHVKRFLQHQIKPAPLKNDKDVINKIINLEHFKWFSFRIHHYVKALNWVKYNDKSFAIYAKRFMFLQSEYLQRTSEKCRDVSVTSEVDDNTLGKLNSYFDVLKNSYESLHECQSILVSFTQHSNTVQNYDSINSKLFRVEIVQSFEKIKADLLDTENKRMVLAIIEEMLHVLLQISNICSVRYQLIRENPHINRLDLFDMRRNVEEILDGRFNVDKAKNEQETTVKKIDVMGTEKRRYELYRMIAKRYGYEYEYEPEILH